MLNKFFKVKKLAPFSHKAPPKQAAVPTSSQTESSSALKIVHAGGFVECYYMAIPAVRILEKHPSCLLARPEVFRRPWDSVVRPDGILTPGEKFFLVPRRTVKKLRRRIRKPDREVSSKSFCQQNDGANESTERSASISSAFKKKTAVKKHVRFASIEEKNSRVEDDPRNRSLNCSSHGVKSRPINSAAAWQ